MPAPTKNVSLDELQLGHELQELGHAKSAGQPSALVVNVGTEDLTPKLVKDCVGHKYEGGQFIFQWTDYNQNKFRVGRPVADGFARGAVAGRAGGVGGLAQVGNRAVAGPPHRRSGGDQI